MCCENAVTRGTLIISLGVFVHVLYVAVTSEETLLAHVAFERALLQVYVAHVLAHVSACSEGPAAHLTRVLGDASAVGLTNVPTTVNDCWEYFFAEWAAGR